MEYTCSKISSSFKKDKLSFPKKGKCKLEDTKLILIVKKDKLFYNNIDDENETNFHMVIDKN